MLRKPLQILVFCTVSGAALAHGNATGIVKERMHGMVLLAGSMKAIAAEIKGNGTPDASKIKAAAQLIEHHAGDNLLALFPKGSLQKASEARQEIWTDWEQFSALSHQLKNLAKGMQLAAENPVSGGVAADQTPVNAQDISLETIAQLPLDQVFTLMGKTCSSCHSDFRIKK